jgi:hypothetical protein
VNIYTDAHWEELLGVIVSRVGTEKFLWLVSKAMHLTKLELLEMLEQEARRERSYANPECIPA